MTTADKAGDGFMLFPYHSIRKISSPNDERAGRTVYTGHASAHAFLDLDEDENVRGDLVTADGKKRQRLSDVHRQIRDTLHNRPENFSILNGGIVFVTSKAEVVEAEKHVRVSAPSIINGSQTRGELARYLEQCERTKTQAGDVYVTYEMIVTDDEDLKAEISIARNFQNDVARISIAGRRGQLDELEARIRESMPDAKLRKSETDRSEEHLDTEKILQVCTALIPAELWLKEKEREDPPKVYSYSMKAKCLRDFQEYHRLANNPTDVEKGTKEQIAAAKLYEFFIDIAPFALKLYSKWKSHQGFKGTGLRSLTRDETGKILDVPDGIVFPILCSLSAFIRKDRGHWIFDPPAKFSDENLIKTAKSQYVNTANSNPWNMGKSKAVYSSLYQITHLYRDLTD